jgi:hypothetical protein
MTLSTSASVCRVEVSGKTRQRRNQVFHVDYAIQAHDHIVRDRIYLHTRPKMLRILEKRKPDRTKMISQKRRRNTNEGQLRNSLPKPLRQQPDAKPEPDYRPIACGMQQLMGYRSKSAPSPGRRPRRRCPLVSGTHIHGNL